MDIFNAKMNLQTCHHIHKAFPRLQIFQMFNVDVL